MADQGGGTIPVVLAGDGDLPPIGTEVHIRFALRPEQQPQQQQQQEEPGDGWEPPPPSYGYDVVGEDGRPIGGTRLIGYVADTVRRAVVVAVEDESGRTVAQLRILDDR